MAQLATERRPAQVGVEQHAGGVEHGGEQDPGPGPGQLGGLLDPVAGDGLPGHLHQHGMGQSGAGQLPRQLVYRGGSRHIGHPTGPARSGAVVER